MKTLPCSACGRWGSSVSAHVLGCEGKSMKKDYTTTAPLCEGMKAVMFRTRPGYVGGCHELYDRYRWLFNAMYPDFNPETAAAQTEAAWQEYQKEKA